MLMAAILWTYQIISFHIHITISTRIHLPPLLSSIPVPLSLLLLSCFSLASLLLLSRSPSYFQNTDDAMESKKRCESASFNKSISIYYCWILQPVLECSFVTFRMKEEKVVMTVRIEGGGREIHKGFGNPSDPWSWRKYGQKPIKGSPYPRGYYRCSTAKGCPAKKQVERSKTDASTLIITYTSRHNHPGSELSTLKSTSGARALETCEQQDLHNCAGPRSESPQVECQEGKSQVGALQEVEKCLDLQEPNSANSDREEELLRNHSPNMINSSQDQSSREMDDDFFDELEELPLSLMCSNVVRSNFFDERILLLPSCD